MEERKLVKLKKEEFAIREEIKTFLGKGKISRVRIEYTPIGEKIIISTHKPGLVIGRKGEKIIELTEILRKRFKFENPHIEIEEIKQPELDSQIMADEIALSLEKFGPIKFKVIAYKTLQRIVHAGALGVEIRLNGKLPSSRAKSWRFAQGYLKKVGDSAKVVDKAKSIAQTKPGVVGVKVSILSPYVKMLDTIKIDDEVIERIKQRLAEEEEKPVKKTVKTSKARKEKEETSPKTDQSKETSPASSQSKETSSRRGQSEEK
jgi:small subunit ribosomal protein S3